MLFMTQNRTCSGIDNFSLFKFEDYDQLIDWLYDNGIQGTVIAQYDDSEEPKALKELEETADAYVEELRRYEEEEAERQRAHESWIRADR